MKKVGIYVIALLMCSAVFFLGFTDKNQRQPVTLYQVYLDGELLGTIDSKVELEDYINNQGTNIKENVKEFQKKLDIIDTVNEILLNIEVEDLNNKTTLEKVKYLINNKANFDISDIKLDSLNAYVADNLNDLSEVEITEMREYVDENNIYLSADTIYSPNGIVIKKIKTYKQDVMSISDMYLEIISREACTIPGYKFTLKDSDDKEKVIYVTDKEIFSEAIDTVASIFIGNDEYTKYKEGIKDTIDTTGSIIEKVYLEEDITYKAVNIDTSEKIYTNKSDLAKYLLYGNDYKEDKVTVNEGDSISTIAFANEISIEEFLISNPEYTNKDNLLYPGKEVVIAKTDPQINIVVESYSVEDKISDFATVEEYDESMTQGNSVVTQEGETGIDRVSQNIKRVNGQITYIEPVGKEVIKTPVNKVVTVGTKVIPNVGSTTSWGWPTDSGYTISSPYGYRISPITGGRELHSGVDISGTGYGSPAYASNNGTIIEMQYHYSYGNYVLIDHGNGYYSQYAHLSRFMSGLGVGSVVERGQQVGYIGMTGSATGPHLHYEIRTCAGYHCTTDPLNYYR